MIQDPNDPAMIALQDQAVAELNGMVDELIRRSDTNDVGGAIVATVEWVNKLTEEGLKLYLVTALAEYAHLRMHDKKHEPCTCTP